MKNVLKLLGITGCAAALALILAACGEVEEKYTTTHSGTLEADRNGAISFSFINRASYGMSSCDFLTELPYPNDEFELKYNNDPLYGNNQISYRGIIGLSPGQKVRWRASSFDYIEKSEENGSVVITAYMLIKK